MSKHIVVNYRKAPRSRPASESSTSSVIGDHQSVRSRASSFAAASEHGRAATVIDFTDEDHDPPHPEGGDEEEEDEDLAEEEAEAEAAAAPEEPVEVLEDDIVPSDSASRPPSARATAHRSSSRASELSRRQVPAPQPPSRRSTNSDLHRFESRTSDQSEPRPSRRRPRAPRAPSNMAGYYNPYEDDEYVHGGGMPPPPGHGHPAPQWQHVSHANHFSPASELTSLSQYAQHQHPQFQQPAPHPPQPQPQQMVPYNPYQFHQQMPAPMGYPGGQQFFPPPQQMMPYLYPYGGYPPPSSPPPPGDETAAKLFDAHMVEVKELMMLSQQAAIAREKEREAALEAEKKAALAKAAKDEEERANAEKVAKAAQKAKEEAEADAAKKAKEAEAAHEKALKEATEKAEKFEKEKKEAEEEAKKLKPPDDATRPPIKFIDAVQRKFVLPWKMCKTWQGMEGLIQQAFVGVERLEAHVQEGHYDLIGPNGEIILPQVWESTVAPDWTIKMQMWQIAEEEPIMVVPEQPKPGKGGKKGSKGKKNRPMSMPGGIFGGGPVEVVNMPPPAPANKSKSKGKGNSMGMLTFFAGGGNSRRSK